MYTVPQHISHNKIFLVQCSELEGRLDAFFYNFKSNLISNFKYPLERIGNSFLVSDGDHDKLPDDVISDSENGYRYLRAQDIKDNKIVDDNPVYINELYFNKIKRCHIYPNDLLISIMASLGSTAIVPKNFPICTANRAIGILRQKNNSKFIVEYVQIIINTSIGYSLFEIEKKGGIQQRFNLSDIINVKIPLPPQDIQKQIIDLYQTAYAQKQQKETEAQKLLAGIDTYLLNELGINLPKKNNSLSDRIFTTHLSNIAGERFDVFAIFNKSYKIEGGKFVNHRLKELAVLVKGQSITSDRIVTGDYPVIAGGKTSPYTHNEYNYKGNVITVSASGAYSGYVWYHTSPIFASDCTVIWSRNEYIINTLFLYEILKVKQHEIYDLQQGAGQPHVYARDLEKLNIPLPPLKKQNEIVSHIQGIRARAKALQQQAKQILEEAKQQVEQMILGD